MTYDTVLGMTREEALALGVDLDYCPKRDRYWLQGKMPPIAIQSAVETAVEPIVTVIEPAAEAVAIPTVDAPASTKKTK
jgi:hypothetical protein